MSIITVKRKKGKVYVARVGNWKEQSEQGEGRESKTFFKREDAELWLAKKRIERGSDRTTNPDFNPYRTIESLFPKYIESMSDITAKERMESIQNVRQVCAHQGIVRLADLTKERLAAFLSSRILDCNPSHTSQKEITTSTKRRKGMHLKRFCNWMVEVGILKVNPLKDVPTKRPVHKKRWALTKEEVAELLATAKANSPNDFYPVIFTLLQTGVRKAELATLEWDDVDFAGRNLRIRNKPDVLIEGRPHTCKWDSERDLPISQALERLLLDLRRSSTSRFVFPNRDGSMRWHNWDRQFRLAIRGAKIRRLKDLTAHVLRHTFLSHLLHYARRDIKEVSALAGHENLETTYGYIDLLSDSKDFRQAVDTLPDYEAGPANVEGDVKKNLNRWAEPENDANKMPTRILEDEAPSNPVELQ